MAIRRDAGDHAGADELLAAIQGDVFRLREAGFATTYYLSTDFEEGLLKYLTGDLKKGLTLMSRASEDGYFIGPKTAYLKELYEDPDFATILVSQQAPQIHERNRFLSIVCTDNPYVAVWQPAKGTCESFAEKAKKGQKGPGQIQKVLTRLVFDRN